MNIVHLVTEPLRQDRGSQTRTCPVNAIVGAMMEMAGLIAAVLMLFWAETHLERIEKFQIDNIVDSSELNCSWWRDA